jgi:hypothetical protein
MKEAKSLCGNKTLQNSSESFRRLQGLKIWCVLNTRDTQPGFVHFEAPVLIPDMSKLIRKRSSSMQGNARIARLRVTFRR